MRIIVDVKCPSGHVNEQYIDNTIRKVDCPQEGCNEVAERIISPVRCSLDPCSGDFPGETSKWLKSRENQMRRERKAIENHGPGAEWDVSR